MIIKGGGRRCRGSANRGMGVDEEGIGGGLVFIDGKMRNEASTVIISTLPGMWRGVVGSSYDSNRLGWEGYDHIIL